MCLIVTASVRPARALLVLLTALAVGLAGLASPPGAHAAGWSLHGSVVGPGGVVPVGAVSAWNKDHSRVARTTVGSDGTFDLQGLQDGARPWILFESADATVAVTGWYLADDQSLLPYATPLLDVPQVSVVSDITLRPIAPRTVWGTFLPPESWMRSSADVTLMLHAGTAPGDTTPVPVAADGSFRLALDPHEDYRLELPPTPGLVHGYWNRNGSLARTFGEATEIDDSIESVTVSPARPSTLRGRVELPPGYTAGTASLRVTVQTGYDDDWRYGASVSVASDGTFSLDRLPTGQAVRLWFADSGRRLLRGFVARDGSTWGRGDGDDILVDGHKVVIRPPLAVSVTGKVVLPADYDWRKTSHPSLELRDADTDAWVDERSLFEAKDGFEFDQLAPDRDYLLLVTDWSNQVDDGYLADSLTGELTTERDNAFRVRGGGAFTLRPESNMVLSGQVVAPNGQRSPVGLVALHETDITSNIRATQWVGADGSFRFVGLEPHESFLVEYEPVSDYVFGGFFSSEQPVLAPSIDAATPVFAGQAGVTLNTAAAAVMTGRVVPPTGYEGTVENSSVYAYPDGHGDEADTRHGYVEKDGTFRITRLDPARFYAVRHSGGSLVGGYLGENGVWEESVSRAVLLPPRAGVVLRPPATQRITGRVELPDGVRRSDVRLEVRINDHESNFIVANDGSFVIDDLRPGEGVRVVLEDVSGVVSGGWYSGAGEPLTRTWEEASAVQPGTTGLVLHPQRMAVVDGIVDLPENVDAAAVDVEIVASPQSGQSAEKATAVVDAAGMYRLQGLDPALTYRLAVTDATRTLVSGYLVASGDLVTDVADGARLRPAQFPRSLSLHRSTSIEVRVEMPSVPGALYGRPSVAAYDAEGRRIASARASESGTAVLAGLAENEAYTIRMAGSGLGTGWFAGSDRPLVAGRAAATAVRAPGAISVAAADDGVVTGRLGKPTGSGYDVVEVAIVDTASDEIVARRSVSPGMAFSFDGLLAGSYVVGANLSDASATYAATFHSAAGTGPVPRAAATPLTVETGGSVSGVSLDTSTCATWSGVVDVPVGDGDLVSVRLWDDGLVVRSWTGHAGEDEFVIGGLAPGAYHVGIAVGAEPERQFGEVTVDSCADRAQVRLGDDPAVIGTSMPQVTGSHQVGSTLTVSAGTWTPASATTSVQWLRDGAPIAGATGSTHRLGTADLGYRVTARVTARYDGMRPRVRVVGPSDEVGRGSLGTGRVTLTGRAALGSSLTAAVSGWPASTPVTWRWERDGEVIAGATGARYEIEDADVDHALTAVATAISYGYVPAVVTSAPRTPRFALYAVSPPRTSGKVAVGATVRAVPGTWSGTPGTVRFAWLRNGAPIAGATLATYAPVAADVGKKLAVRVTATLTGYPSASAVSTTSTVVAGTIRNVTRPTVTGTARVGATVRVSSGRWSVPGVTIRYQWLRDGRAIAGATKATYTARSADARTRLSVRVTASRPGYRAAAVTASTSAVTKPAAAYF